MIQSAPSAPSSNIAPLKGNPVPTAASAPLPVAPRIVLPVNVHTPAQAAGRIVQSAPPAPGNNIAPLKGNPAPTAASDPLKSPANVDTPAQATGRTVQAASFAPGNNIAPLKATPEPAMAPGPAPVAPQIGLPANVDTSAKGAETRIRATDSVPTLPPAPKVTAAPEGDAKPDSPRKAVARNEELAPAAPPPVAPAISKLVEAAYSLPIVLAPATASVSPTSTLRVDLPVEQSATTIDTSSRGTGSTIQAADSVTVPLATKVAFQARVVDKNADKSAEDDAVNDTVELSPRDWFVQPGDAKPADDPLPQPVNRADASQPASNPETPRKEVSRTEKIAPAAPRPAEPPVSKAVEEAYSFARSVPSDAGGSTAADTSSEASPTDSPTVRSPEPPNTVSRPTQPVRELAVRLSSDSQQVDVKLVERGGEVHVAVNSADATLTTDLRAALHDLAGGLEKSGFRAEIWQPGENLQRGANSTAGASQGSGDQPQQQPGEDPRRQGRNVYQPEYTPSRRNRDDHSDWSKQIDALMGAGKES